MWVSVQQATCYIPQNTVPYEQTGTGSELRVCVTINGGKNVENDDRETHRRERGQADWKR